MKPDSANIGYPSIDQHAGMPGNHSQIVTSPLATGHNRQATAHGRPFTVKVGRTPPVSGSRV
jgi:hypothetical protein